MASFRLALARPRASLAAPSLARTLATPAAVPHRPSHRVLILGGGAAGQAIAHQLTRSGRFAAGEIGVIDPSSTHDYQPGWTLVGGGLKQKEELRRPLADLLADTAGVVSLLPHTVTGLKPESNVVQTESGEVGYEHLVVAAGIDCKWDKVEGLAEALKVQGSGVSSIYSYVSRRSAAAPASHTHTTHRTRATSSSRKLTSSRRARPSSRSRPASSSAPVRRRSAWQRWRRRRSTRADLSAGPCGWQRTTGARTRCAAPTTPTRPSPSRLRAACLRSSPCPSTLPRWT
jgi:hypothetical protein